MAENRKIWTGVIALAAAAVILAAVFLVFREKPVEGSKNITIEVVGSTQTTTTYQVKTDAQYLLQVLEEADGLTLFGTQGEYGMMVDTVNNERADYAKDGAYWAFYVNGDYCNYGIDSQPVEDGDIFRIVYTVSTAQ